MSLDTDIDALYQKPLAEFTTSRNALAKTLTGEAAKRVKGLAKPTVAPWAVNQLYWNARGVYDRLLKAGDALRKAQMAALEGGKADVRKASEAHRAALAAAVEKATALADAAGARPDPDALTRTLESLSLAAERPGTPGRLTDVLRPAGFEALLGVTPASGPKPVAAPASRGTASAERAPAPAGESAAARRARREAEREAEREAAREAARARAREEERAKARKAAVQAAERHLAKAQAAQAKAKRQAEDAQQALEAANAAVRDAERALFAAKQA